MNQCINSTCQRSAVKRGMCSMHYQRWRKHGDMDAVAMTMTVNGPEPLEHDPLRRFLSRIQKSSEGGCWLWTARTQQGYGIFSVSGRETLAYRWAYEHFVGPIPEGMCACHKCDTPACCNPEHLFLGTRRDNFDDMRAKGRDARGERNGKAKLTAGKAESIRNEYAARRVSLRELAERYGVHQSTIGLVVKGVTWRRRA